MMFAPDFGPRSSSSEDEGQVKLRPRATSSCGHAPQPGPAPKDRAMPSFLGSAIQRLLAFEVRLKHRVWVLLLGLRLYAAARCQRRHRVIARGRS